MEAVQVPCHPLLYQLLKARGARIIRIYDYGETHIIYTEEPFGRGALSSPFGVHISISARGRHPTWEEQRDAVWTICPGVTMASYIPPQSRFSTLPDSHVFHWFEVLSDNDHVEHLGDWL
jgi:hypothetical protein